MKVFPQLRKMFVVSGVGVWGFVWGIGEVGSLANIAVVDKEHARFV